MGVDSSAPDATGRHTSASRPTIRPNAPETPAQAPESLAIDPVCGMPVARDHSISLQRRGRLHYFCSRGCRDEFLGVGGAREEARAEELVRRILDAPGLIWPVFQPILSLETRHLVGYEALTRFAPVPLQPPEAWFELAARAGLTVELEALALRTALEAAARRPPPAGTFVSLNVSPLLLDDARIASALAAPSIAPDRLVLELTERDPVADYEGLRAALAPYRARGYRLAVDDAGAGYASMRHITELAPDFVKLDAGLIRGLSGGIARQALIRAMATFVAEIGAVLVAEGVENLDDLDLLGRARRPILVQGYAVGLGGDPWPAPSASAIGHLRSLRGGHRDPRSPRGSANS